MPKPPWFFWLFIVIAIASAAQAIWSFLIGSYGIGLCDTWTVIFSWEGAMAVWDRRQIHPLWLVSQLVNMVMILFFTLITG